MPQATAKIESKTSVILNVIDYKCYDIPKKALLDPDWNIDKFGLSAGINIECKTSFTFAPAIFPSDTYDEVSLNFYISNPSEELIRGRVIFRGIDGKPRYLPVIPTDKELGVLSFLVPVEEVNYNLPFSCNLNLQSSKTIYLQGSWLELAVLGKD